MDNFTIVNKTVTLVGKRGSGKSEMLKYLVDQHKQAFRRIFVISPTESINSFYVKSGLVDKDNVFDIYEEEWAEKLISQMTKENANKTKETASQVLLILDDCVSDTKFHQSPTIKKIYTRSRHFFLSVIITTQYLYSIPPVCRNNSDFILCGQLNRASLGLLNEEFCSADIDKTQFIQMYSKATKNYGFFVINTSSVTDGADLNSVYGIARTPL
jgi:nicotinamide riboside kinase